MDRETGRETGRETEHGTGGTGGTGYGDDVEEVAPRPRGRRAVVGIVAAATMLALAVGAAAPLLLHAGASSGPRLAGWTRSSDGDALLVAVAWGPPAEACSDVYLRDLDDPDRTALRIWRDCGAAGATARFDGAARVVVESPGSVDGRFVTGFDLAPLRADPVRCTTRCGDDPAARAVAEAFEPPAQRGGTA